MNPKHIIITTILALLLCGMASAAWANTSYTNAKNITLLGTDTELTNYPYLVSITKESAMQSDYDDLIFYDQPVYSGGNLIEFEIETYNATVATVWLNITTLPSAGKTVSVYYGNATITSTENSNATWNGDYVGVWHMSDDTSYAWNNYKDADGVITSNASMRYGILEVSIYHEDGIFKSWKQTNFGTTGLGLGYFTSVNGYDWTYIKENVIGADESVWHRHPFVMQDPDNPGEYWAYTSNYTTHKEDLWHGYNETNWSIDTYGIFSASDVGGSDMGNIFVWRENTSDWYTIVEYGGGGGWISKYGTSSNGKDWTFHSQCIVSGFGSNGLCDPWVEKNGGTYYMWFHGNKGSVSGIPSDTYVATSTNRQDWTYIDGFEITRQYDWEGVGETGGQAEGPCIVEYNNEVYIYYSGKHDQTPDATWPMRIGVVHLNETLEELCERMGAGTPNKVSDSTSNDRDGTPTDIATSTNGAIGSCMEFDGDSSYIDLGTVLNLATVGTHSFWCNASVVDAINRRIYVHNDAGGGTPMVGSGVLETTGIDELDAFAGGASFTRPTVSENQFYNVVVITNSSGNDVLYVDGNEIDTNVHGTGYAGDISAWYFGTTRGKSAWFAGTIDEGRVSDVVRSADWINLSYQVVVNSSYVAFGTEETYTHTDIVLGANKYGMLRKDVTSAQTFSTIATGFTYDVCFTWWDDVTDSWLSYWVGDSYNSGQSIPEHESYFVLMDGTGETVSCSVASAETVAIPVGWSCTYLRESTSKTLTAIKTDMGGNCADLYAWDHTASGTGAWTDTGAYSVLPNQGLLVNASTGFNWDGAVP